MIVVLATIQPEIAKLEALCIKKTLKRKGYVNIKVQVSSIFRPNRDNSIYKIWLVKVPPEVCLLLGWSPNNELNKLLGIPEDKQISLLDVAEQQKAYFN